MARRKFPGYFGRRPDRQETRREQAKDRQAVRALRSSQEQLARLSLRPGTSLKETKQLLGVFLTVGA